MRREGTVQMSFRIDEVLAREFKSECALRKESLQTVLNRAIKEYVAQGKAEEKTD